jgi:hypothetical protein
MLRSLPKPLLIAGLLAIGALVPWFLTAKRSQRVGGAGGAACRNHRFGYADTRCHREAGKSQPRWKILRRTRQLA